MFVDNSKIKLVQTVVSNITHIKIDEKKAKVYARAMNIFDIYSLIRKVEVKQPETVRVGSFSISH